MRAFKNARLFAATFGLAVTVFGTGLVTEAQATCPLTPEKIEKLNYQRQSLLNLSTAKGKNFSSLKKSRILPDPVFIRNVAEAFKAADLRGVRQLGSFDKPDAITSDLNKTADLLEAALSDGNAPGSAAWMAFSDFYSPRFYGRHNASLNYYLSKTGCQW